MKKNKIIYFASILIIIISLILFLAVKYMYNHFGNMFTEIMFYIFNGVENTGGNALIEGVKASIIPFIILFVYLIIPIIGFIKYKVSFNIKVKNKQLNISLPIKHKLLYSFIILCLSLSYCYVTCDIKTFVESLNAETKIYDEYYADGKKLDIKFPEEKQNLIIIFAESLESTLITKENGGSWDYSLIPELEELALTNTNFSNNEKIGGAYSTTGTTWTVSGMVAQTAGISMAMFQENGNNNNYKKDSFLDGAYGLGDILADNGYNLEIIMGSDSEFGGRKQYYTNHGNYKIFDYNYAYDNKLVDDYIWWGFEDYKLFDFAKEELLELSSKDEPFNLTLLTADTHFWDGCLKCVRDEYKVTKYENTYENVYASSSKEIAAFINWVKNQDFYKNTTIVVIGDHLSMQNEFFSSRNIPGQARTVYNAFINSKIETEYSKNRTFGAFDIYPTILASIGVEIPGERLGLGTNLYSGKETLFEELGAEYVNSELSKKSTYYNKNILGNDYAEIIIGDYE